MTLAEKTETSPPESHVRGVTQPNTKYFHVKGRRYSVCKMHARARRKIRVDVGGA